MFFPSCLFSGRWCEGLASWSVNLLQLPVTHGHQVGQMLYTQPCVLSMHNFLAGKRVDMKDALFFPYILGIDSAFPLSCL